MERLIKKSFGLFLIIAFFGASIPNQVWAQELPQGEGNVDGGLFGDGSSIGGVEFDESGQAAGSVFGTQNERDFQAEFTEGFATIATEGLGTCAVSDVLANGIRSAVSELAGEAVGEVAGELQRVPIFDPDSKKTRQKEVASQSLNLFGVDVDIMPSWDSLAYCLVNQMIEYIGQATVDWINSGFDGNPVFVDNPGKFFGDIADIEAGIFIEELGLGFMCEPFTANITIALAERQTRTYRDYATCSFSEVSGNLEQFLSGETFSWEDWISVTQYPQNNIYGSYMIATAELDSRIAGRQAIEGIQLDWGNGFLSFKDEEGNISTPGNIIEHRINERLGAGERRIEMADEFDEIVNALVNQLVKIAVNQVLDQE